MKTKYSVRKYRSLEAHQQRRITNSHATPSVPLVSRHPFANDRQAAPTKAPTGNSYHVTKKRKSKNSDDRHLPNPGLHSRQRSPMSAKVDLFSKNTVWRTSVHRFVRMRFLYFTSTVFEHWHSTALARRSHHQRIKNCFRYALSTTIISYRSPSFTSAGVLRALANP